MESTLLPVGKRSIRNPVVSRILCTYSPVTTNLSDLKELHRAIIEYMRQPISELSHPTRQV
ncbi:hypothetical protein M404DRAFT_1007381 [Pisolithus tinctorius Marx 270]|uniref:Uncharacterized protein n=1 Tax=Pisolithus tinctorius Marx 270 TaxID=870435 RepID=A0A0C3NIS5_PISTI|nr:hypothetical protein M404DRAFT_1007381 [Pisolithus tinctorius Marx 270]